MKNSMMKIISPLFYTIQRPRQHLTNQRGNTHPPTHPPTLPPSSSPLATREKKKKEQHRGRPFIFIYIPPHTYHTHIHTYANTHINTHTRNPSFLSPPVPPSVTTHQLGLDYGRENTATPTHTHTWSSRHPVSP